jgi:hypothetical protein
MSCSLRIQVHVKKHFLFHRKMAIPSLVLKNIGAVSADFGIEAFVDNVGRHLKHLMTSEDTHVCACGIFYEEKCEHRLCTYVGIHN